VPSLLAKEGPLAGQRLTVESALTLGRGEADVVIDDPEISRRHAIVRVYEDHLEIEDLDSLNGTWVNGTRISESVRLAPADVVRLGRTVLEVETDEVLPLQPLPAENSDFSFELLARAQPQTLTRTGTVVNGRCSECGAQAPSFARFCSSCGVAFGGDEQRAPEPSAPVGRDGEVPPTGDELRPVTALFADVVGSTALGERLAPDEVKALIGECVNRIAGAVEQFGGTVTSYMGDGIAAFFGLPTAHEDDPERAGLAALRVLEVVAEYAVDIEAAWGVTDFSVRVGVNSGQTAVGLVGAADQQRVALGDTANVAARLQAVAAPGTAVVGESTARALAHRFVLEALGEVSVKGRTQPVGAWRLVQSQAEARAPVPTPLVGRDAEVGKLRTAVDELANGRGQVLLLVGDSGFGKTRLLGELGTVAGDRVVWLEGHCRSYGGELLYWPFVDLLRGWIGVEHGDAEIALRTKLRAKLSALGHVDPGQVLPGLARLLSIRVDTDADRTGRGEELEPEDDEGEIHRAFCAWVEALSLQRPVVVAIDDLHWADPQTRELAESLLAVTDRAQVLVAAALRSEPASEGSRFRLHALENYSHRVLELDLGPLSEAASEELLSMLMPDGLDERARRELISRAEGNPLYLEELLRSLIEGGELERRHRTWAFTAIRPAALPPALEGLLMARIDRLPEEARRLAQVAAVVGRQFPAPALERASGMPEREFEAALSVLLRAQFIRELRRDPQLVYTFKHGLLQEAALSTLTPARRQELYGKVAAVFEDLYATSRDEHLEILAHYYVRSRDLQKACEYLELAGDKAASLNAADRARELYERAQKLAVKLGDDAAEQRLAARLGDLA
jgi:class 3 adenylate cyclase